MAAIPADMTSTPWSSSSVGWQPNLSARRFFKRTSAKGLRQVFPVQTTTMINVASRFKAASVTTPGGGFHAAWLHAYHGRSLAKARWTIDQHQFHVVSESLGGLFGGGRWSAPGRLALVSAMGPANRSMTSRIKSWAGTRSPTVPCGQMAC